MFKLICVLSVLIVAVLVLGRHMPRLQWPDVSHTNITDEAVSSQDSLHTLKQLDVHGCRILDGSQR